MTQTNFLFNAFQLLCCCTFITLGTRWFRFASVRWIFGRAAELSHPQLVHQAILWWLSPTLSFGLLNYLAYGMDETTTEASLCRQKIALVIAFSFTLWSINNNSFPFQTQTLWDFEKGGAKIIGRLQ